MPAFVHQSKTLYRAPQATISFDDQEWEKWAARNPGFFKLEGPAPIQNRLGPHQPARTSKPMSQNALTCLATLDKVRSKTVSQIAKLAQATPRAVRSALDRLVREGLVVQAEIQGRQRGHEKWMYRKA